MILPRATGLLAAAPLRLAPFCLAPLFFAPAAALAQPAAAPVVGVATARMEAVYETSQYVGRILAEKTVHLVARVTGFLEQRLFRQGSDVARGQLLYIIEQPPYQAAVAQSQAAVAQASAQLSNAITTLNRELQLLHTPAGQQSTVDNDRATQLSDAAQLASARAQLETANINLGYTEIRAPIAGRIGITNISEGNVVSPSSGTLATIVSQDPMYVAFEMPMVDALNLNTRYRAEGGLAALGIRIILPDGQTYAQLGKVDFESNTVSSSTDTILVRGTIANPPLPGTARHGTNQGVSNRELTDGEFVTVILRGLKPQQSVVVPRQAVLNDQLGTYVLVVDQKSVVDRRPVTLGQTTPATAVIASGLASGERVIIEGIQRVRPGLKVNAEPVTVPAMPAPSGKS
jgi:membrane fusion protein, multidrug efflux system